MKKTYISICFTAIFVLFTTTLSYAFGIGGIEDSTTTISQKSITIQELNKLAGFTIAPGAQLPSSVDLSNLMPPAGNQRSQGSCSGWAVAYATKTFHEDREEKWYLSQNQFSPSWIYNQINGGKDNGAKISSALNLVVNNGCDLLQYFPYDEYNCSKLPDSNSLIRAKKFKSASWYTIPRDNNIIQSIKNILANGNVVPFGIAVYDDLDSISDPNNLVYDNLSGTNRGLHYMCIVGYDDSMQAFKFLNSWGTTFGRNGYAWLSYRLCLPEQLGSFFYRSYSHFQAYVLIDSPNIYPDGSKIKIPGDPNIYLIDGGKKHIISPEIYDRLFKTRNDIISTWKATTIPTGSPITENTRIVKVVYPGVSSFIADIISKFNQQVDTYYFLDGFTKRKITGDKEYTQYQFKYENVPVVAPQSLDVIPNGSDINGSVAATVFPFSDFLH